MASFVAEPGQEPIFSYFRVHSTPLPSLSLLFFSFKKEMMDCVCVYRLVFLVRSLKRQCSTHLKYFGLKFHVLGDTGGPSDSSKPTETELPPSRFSHVCRRCSFYWSSGTTDWKSWCCSFCQCALSKWSSGYLFILLNHYEIIRPKTELWSPLT